MPGDPGATVVTNSCATYTLRTRLRVRRAPGIPHALLGRVIAAKTRAQCAAGMRRCVWIIHVIARSAATKQSILTSRLRGLLRCARNDGVVGCLKFGSGRRIPEPLQRRGAFAAFARQLRGE
jgi:hypothetical protein